MMDKGNDLVSELFFLGTGAADWLEPSPTGEFRAFSSLLVDGHILIDCTGSSLSRMKEFKADESAITDIFITHSHDDHFDLKAIEKLAAARIQKGYPPLKVHVEQGWASEIRTEYFTVNPLKEAVEVQAGKYKVLPLASNHKGVYENETPLYYLLHNDHVCWLYSTDGSWFLNRTWARLREFALDCWVVDCTIGDANEGDYRIFDHNSLPMIRIMAETLFKQGVLKEDASIILTHLAKTLHPGQEQLEKALGHPFIPAYDGFKYIIRGHNHIQL